MQRRILLSVGLCFLTFLFFATAASWAAEGGARPISMGGAFIGLADDVHAATWNPAGLGWLDDKEVTYSGTINSRSDYLTGDFISDDYISYVQPLKGGYQRNFEGMGAFGIFLHNNNYSGNAAKVTTYQPGIAYGRQFSEDISFGLSVNYYSFDMKVGSVSADDTVFSYTLGVLWYVRDNFSVGCTWENINEPSYTLFGVENKLVRILRPGVAYYFNEDTVITLDIYDLTGNTEDRSSDFSQDIRIGMEHYLSDVLTIRSGVRHPNSDVDTVKAYTFGLGWQRSDFLGIHPVNFYLDYTFVYWSDPDTSMDDYTHQLGASIKF